MATLKAITERDIARQMLLALFLVTVACAGIFGLFAYFWSLEAGSFAFLGFECCCFAFIPTWSARIAKRREAERAQWLKDYKASPESHLLHLND